MKVRRQNSNFDFFFSFSLSNLGVSLHSLWIWHHFALFWICIFPPVCTKLYVKYWNFRCFAVSLSSQTMPILDFNWFEIFFCFCFSDDVHRRIGHLWWWQTENLINCAVIEFIRFEFEIYDDFYIEFWQCQIGISSVPKKESTEGQIGLLSARII